MKTNFTLTILLIALSIGARAQWVPCNNGMDNYVWGSAVYNGNLYACGNFEHADGNQCLGIAKWNGSGWSDVGGGFQYNAFTNVVRGLIVFNNELYAGGYVDSVAGMSINKVAKWNGTGWSAVGTNCPISTVNCFAIHNAELYAGGTSSGAVKCSVAKWDGSNWINLDPSSGNLDVSSLASYNGDLYAAGNFTSINGVTANKIAKWNGSTWSDVNGEVSGGIINIVRALAVFNNKLYAGGNFTNAGGVAVNHVASWDGTSWYDVGSGVGGSTAIVQTLLTYGNKLFIGGTFWEVNSVTANRAAYWDGSAWTVLGTDLGAGARSLSIFNNELYSFGELASNGQNYAAKWGGGTFTGIKENKEKTSITVYPDPVSTKLFVSSNIKADHFIVTDIAGRKMDVNIISAQELSGTTEIDVSMLASGIYTLSSEEATLAAEKFIVLH